MNFQRQLQDALREVGLAAKPIVPGANLLVLGSLPTKRKKPEKPAKAKRKKKKNTEG